MLPHMRSVMECEPVKNEIIPPTIFIVPEHVDQGEGSADSCISGNTQGHSVVDESHSVIKTSLLYKLCDPDMLVLGIPHTDYENLS